MGEIINRHLDRRDFLKLSVGSVTALGLTAFRVPGFSQAIAAAVDADAVRFAPTLLGDARRYLGEAETHIRNSSFNLARTNAIRAKLSAVDALQASQAASQSADN